MRRKRRGCDGSSQTRLRSLGSKVPLPEYRIQKRVEPGRDVPFEFRAEKVGRFEFYCSLTNDSCRERGMVGTLIVVAR